MAKSLEYGPGFHFLRTFLVVSAGHAPRHEWRRWAELDSAQQQVKRPRKSTLTMRFVQNILLVIGVTALGTVLGSFFLGFLFLWLRQPTGERGLGLFLAVFFCGAPLGATLGLGGALWWIARSGAGDACWDVASWTGIALGLIVSLGVPVLRGFRPREVSDWWLIAIAAPAFGTVGGILASMAAAIWKSVTYNAARRHERKSPEEKKKKKKNRETGPGV
jgi:hypothetical protein